MAVNPAFSALMPNLLQSGKYSDLTIVCGSDRYAVHKSIVCVMSSVIAAPFEDHAAFRVPESLPDF